MWITLKISNEVIGFVRHKIRMVIKISSIKESYSHFHRH